MRQYLSTNDGRLYEGGLAVILFFKTVGMQIFLNPLIMILDYSHNSDSGVYCAILLFTVKVSNNQFDY